jgi:Ca2+-dependent lipid-binding protein
MVFVFVYNHVIFNIQVSAHDLLGMQVVRLSDLTPEEPKTLTLPLRKNMNDNDQANQKNRGEISLELLYKPFKEDPSDSIPEGDQEEEEKAPEGTPEGGGLLIITVHDAEDLEGKHHNNPYARVLYKGVEHKTSVRTYDSFALNFFYVFCVLHYHHDEGCCFDYNVSVSRADVQKWKDDFWSFY